jgi:hypothetical protein
MDSATIWGTIAGLTVLGGLLSYKAARRAGKGWLAGFLIGFLVALVVVVLLSLVATLLLPN